MASPLCSSRCPSDLIASPRTLIAVHEDLAGSFRRFPFFKSGSDYQNVCFMCDDPFSNPAMLSCHLFRCGPCKFIGPIFEKMSDEMPEIDFIKVDVDEAEEIAAGECVKSLHLDSY